MPITQKFERLTWQLVREQHPEHRDGFAVSHLTKMLDLDANSPESTYARSSWGYTILRTTYNKESDALIPLALEKLQRWEAQYWLHADRFPLFGQKAIDKQKVDGSANDELGRRLCFELVEDRNDPRLQFQRLSEAKQEDIHSLVEVFTEWVASVGESLENPPSPRFCDFLVLDQESLDALLRMPDTTPPLRPAQDLAEKIRWRSDGDSFLWLVDPAAVRSHAEDETPQKRGWMKVRIFQLDTSWFTRASFIRKGPAAFVCYAKDGTPNDFWFGGV